MTTTQDFASLGLRPELVDACRGRGFRTPMPIQAQAIPVLMAGRDALIQAKTGSGKTLAYGLPMMQGNAIQSDRPEALVVTPTRELASQVGTELRWAGAAVGRTVQLISGGERTEKQQTQLAKGCNIVVGTAGRLLDLVRRGGLHLNHVRYLVLDEADELLQRGFGEDLDALAALLPAKRQTILCSATIPVEVETLAKRFMHRPERIGGMAGKELPAEVTHRVIFTTIDDRTADLITWLQLERPYQALIFTGSRAEADDLTPALTEVGLEAETFHGDLSAVKRRQLIERFRSGDLAVLVATDIAARGLDLPGVTHVVNHSLPKGLGAYVHRTGRTGRAGKTGLAVSFVIPQENDRLERLRQSFAFQAMTLRGAKAGEVRALKTEKMKQTRQDRRGLTKRWEKEAEIKAAKKAKAEERAKAEKAAAKAAIEPGRLRSGRPSGGRAGRPDASAKPDTVDQRPARSASQSPSRGPAKASGPVTGKTPGRSAGPASGKSYDNGPAKATDKPSDKPYGKGPAKAFDKSADKPYGKGPANAGPTAGKGPGKAAGHTTGKSRSGSGSSARSRGPGKFGGAASGESASRGPGKFGGTTKRSDGPGGKSPGRKR
jgi:ATP-dependent RNA helicase DeaD